MWCLLRTKTLSFTAVSTSKSIIKSDNGSFIQRDRTKTTSFSAFFRSLSLSNLTTTTTTTKREESYSWVQGGKHEESLFCCFFFCNSTLCVKINKYPIRGQDISAHLACVRNFILHCSSVDRTIETVTVCVCVYLYKSLLLCILNFAGAAGVVAMFFGWMQEEPLSMEFEVFSGIKLIRLQKMQLILKWFGRNPLISFYMWSARLPHFFLNMKFLLNHLNDHEMCYTFVNVGPQTQALTRSNFYSLSKSSPTIGVKFQINSN